ncbi:HNH endonuclease [Phragmitibacter flavus]|uniref:HNH endonuclease n=1 Tax=Phragmitibacter flavus TaxID=2576071 RepID=A0A5R8KE65_9BACT|nr:HNH endonuclease [Phragmitibacter flavus]TLD70235.1 HNH endonuclease [Phragmitibacter flavus]
MSDVLHKTTVLVLNRNWQAIDVKSPADAFCMMAAGTATALSIGEEGEMFPEKWDKWFALPVRDSDNFVRTVHGPVRVPTVIVLAKYDKVPRRRPKLSGRGIWERDGGVCQYTGRKLARDEGNIDHVVPRSRGGKTTWDNCVLADKRVNSRKADKLPDEAGLKLQRKPAVPRDMPSTYYIRNVYGVADWDMFLG